MNLLCGVEYQNNKKILFYSHKDGLINGTKKKINAVNMSQEERIQRHSENIEAACKFCDKSVKSHRVSLKVKQERNNSYHLKSQYVCCVCGTITNTPSAFLSHNNHEFSKYHLSDKSLPVPWHFDCNLCGQTIDQHKYADQDYICCHCNEEFGAPNVLTTHLKTVSTDSSVNCNICEKTLLKSNIKKHMNKFHSEVTSISKADSLSGFKRCPDCDSFDKKTKPERLKHYKICHPDVYKIVLKSKVQAWSVAPSTSYTQCNLCSIKIRKCNLKNHKLHIHGVNLDNVPVIVPKVSCDICGFVSKHAKDLKKHKATVHDKEFKFTCNFCGKKFHNRGNLNQHEVIHTGISPYQCDICGKQCRRKKELQKHVETHNSGSDGGGGGGPEQLTSLVLSQINNDTGRPTEFLKEINNHTVSTTSAIKIYL